MIALLAGMVLVMPQVLAAEAGYRRLPVAEYRDKMKGAWLGQMIGVGWGQPTEKGPVSGHFSTEGCIMPKDRMLPWKPEMVNQHHNDDCYVEMTFMKTLETYGFDVSLRQAGIDFANSGYGLAHANNAGRDNLRKGIAPPESGNPQFNKHADDIDYQIEADYSGIIAPGLPNTAIALGEKFGRLMNYGDGVYAGQFIGGMYAEAYFQSDPWKIVEAGLKCLPPDSQYAEMVRDLMEWCRANPDWTRTWQLADDKYHKDRRYYGHLCGLDVKLNGTYVIMGLLYGRNDLDKTIVSSCRCGFDSDCNPANAAGVLGAMLGASRIPARFTEKLDPTRKFSFSDYTLSQVYDLGEKLARQAVVRAGGRVEKDANGEDVFVIPVQTPDPGKAEKSYEPGPIANSKFTEAEMAQISISARPAAPAAADVKKTFENFAPGWTISQCGTDMDTGLRAEEQGRKNVFVTHPLNRDIPCVLSRKLEIPATKKTTLNLTVGHHPTGDWDLIVRADKRELLRKTIGSTTAANGWLDVTVDLSEFAGKSILLELVNMPTGWAWEAGYWARISVETK